MAAKETLEKVEVPVSDTESVSLKVLSCHDHGSLNKLGNIENSTSKVLSIFCTIFLSLLDVNNTANSLLANKSLRFYF